MPRFGGCWEQKPKAHTWAGGEVWNPGRPCRSLAVGSSARSVIGLQGGVPFQGWLAGRCFSPPTGCASELLRR